MKDIDTDKIDLAVLALLYLASFGDGEMHRAWKGHDWESLGRLFEKKMIFDPKGKTKSVVFTEEGFAQAKKHFETLFAKD